MAVLDRERNCELHALAGHAVFIEPVDRAVSAFLQYAADAGAHAALRRIEHVVDAFQHRVMAVLREEILHPRAAAVARRHLRHQVALAVMRHARIEVKHFEHVGARLARRVNLHRRHADAFLKNADAVARFAAGHAPADIRMMRDRRGERDEAAVVENRRRDRAVVQMRDTDDVRIIGEKCIAGLQRFERKALEYRAHHAQRRAQMRGRIGHQRERAPAGVAERRRAVGALLDVRRKRRAHEARRHFVRRRFEGGGDDFQLRVGHAYCYSITSRTRFATDKRRHRRYSQTAKAQA